MFSDFENEDCNTDFNEPSNLENEFGVSNTYEDDPEEQGRPSDEEFEGCEDYKVTRKESPAVGKYKHKINAAYLDHKSGVAGAEDTLLSLVIEFASKKAHYRLLGIPETDKDADDVGQETGLRVWSNLDRFSGDPAKFFNWVCTIGLNRSKTAQSRNTKATKGRVPLQVMFEDGAMDDNKELHKPSELRPEPTRKLPDWIQGDDAHICRLIRSGCDYKEIARVLETTEPAIRNKIYRMRRRIKAEKAAAIDKK